MLFRSYPGTGGALMQGQNAGANAKKPFCYQYDEILILNGDMPLVCSQTLKSLCQNKAQIVMSVLHLQNPDGYGRVVMESGVVQRIIEQKDAKESELLIKDVNAGVYKIHKSILDLYLPQVGNANNQQEFYLTDVVFYAKENGIEIAALEVKEEEFMGVNSKIQLACAQEIGRAHV